jgi:hypothetical protein
MNQSSESDDESVESNHSSNNSAKRAKSKHDKRDDANSQRLIDATEVRNLILGSESSPKQIMQKIINMKSALWTLGEGFSKYAHLRTKKDIVVCNLCVSSENWSTCEIDLGIDRSTTGLKSHFKTHHYPIYEAFINSIVKFEVKSVVSPPLKVANPISNYFAPQLATKQLFKLCKLFVKKYFPLCLIEGDKVAYIFI